MVQQRSHATSFSCRSITAFAKLAYSAMNGSRRLFQQVNLNTSRPDQRVIIGIKYRGRRARSAPGSGTLGSPVVFVMHPTLAVECGAVADRVAISYYRVREITYLIWQSSATPVPTRCMPVIVAVRGSWHFFRPVFRCDSAQSGFFPPIQFLRFAYQIKPQINCNNMRDFLAHSLSVSRPLIGV